VWSLDTHRAENPPAVSFVRLEPSGEVGPDPTRVLRLDGSTVRVYDATTAKPAGPPLVHGAPVTLAVFSPDGSLVATAARDHTARVWDAATGKPLTPPLRHGRVIYQAAFSDNGKRLLTASEDGVVRVWDLAPRDPVQPLATLAKGGPSALSPDGRLVAITDAKGAVWVCDSASNKVIHGPWKLNRPATAVLFSPDGRRVLAASEGDGRVWDVGTGEAVTPVLAHSGPVKRLLYAAGGKRFAIQGGNDRLETYDAATGSLLYSHALPVKDTPGGPALTPDGNAVAVVSRSGMDVEIRDVVSGERRAGPFRHAALVAATAVSPDGTRLAVATADGTVFLWDVATGRPAAPVMQHGAPLRQVAFSGDGRFLASVAEDHTARVWEVRTGLAVTPLLTHPEAIAAAGLAADGTRLALRGEGGACAVWDLSPDTRSADDLVHLTQVLSGEVLDGRSGGFEPLEPARLRDAWPRLRARYAGEFARAP
jgi:WD40 repeat protein